VNPTLAFPPPVIVHDDAERITAGAALSWHDASVVNPVPEPETIVPIGPDVGVSANVPGGPDVTAKVAVAESGAPRFVVTVTVYEVPTTAPAATVNPLPAVRLPAASEHDDEVKRPPGLEVSWHVEPAKLEPDATTGVAPGPEIGVSVSEGGGGTLNAACAASPEVPVTMTV